jgi:hypothetical protein
MDELQQYGVVYGRFDRLEHVRLLQATVPLPLLFCLASLL